MKGVEGRIAAGLAQYGLSPAPARQLTRYCALLLEQNRVMNLTAITDPEQAADLHMLDSAALLTAAQFAGKTVLDVGTGAGFPGLVLKLLEPSAQVTLLDGLGKRIHWLETIAPELGAADVRCVHGRGEELARQEGWREGFQFVVSRAVAELSLLSELCLPFVAVGGRFLAMKGPDCQAETDRASRAISILGGRLRAPVPYRIPGTEVTRNIVVVEKIRATPDKYPRRFAKMKKQPL